MLSFPGLDTLLFEVICLEVKHSMLAGWGLLTSLLAPPEERGELYHYFSCLILGTAPEERGVTGNLKLVYL